MRTAGRAWLGIAVLVAGIVLLPGLLYLLGMALVDGRPKPAGRAASNVAACGTEPRAEYQPMNPWRFTAQFFDKDVMKKAPEVEREALWIAQSHLSQQPHRGMLRRHLSSAALTIWITRHWGAAQIADTARKQGFCQQFSRPLMK